VDSSKGVIRWSAQRAHQHLQAVVIAAIAIPLAAVIAALFIALPSHPTITDRIVQEAEALAVGLLIVLLVAFVYAFLLAPYEQRNTLRKEINALRDECGQSQVAEVWPRVDSSKTTRSLGGDRTITIPDWHLVLINSGDMPAHNVRVRIEPSKPEDGVWTILGDSPGSGQIEILAPHSEAKFLVIAAADDPVQVRCIVSWTDNRGDRQNTATIRRT